MSAVIEGFSYHFSLSFDGELTDDEKCRRMTFAWLLAKADVTDWPMLYDWKNDTLEPAKPAQFCPKCKGFVYKRPRIGAAHMFGLAKKLGLKLIVNHFTTNKTCDKREAKTA